MARDACHIEVQNYGMACQPSQFQEKYLKTVSFNLILGLNFITPL